MTICVLAALLGNPYPNSKEAATAEGAGLRVDVLAPREDIAGPSLGSSVLFGKYIVRYSPHEFVLLYECI
jgi:hypothetical protein